MGKRGGDYDNLVQLQEARINCFIKLISELKLFAKPAVNYAF